LVQTCANQTLFFALLIAGDTSYKNERNPERF